MLPFGARTFQEARDFSRAQALHGSSVLALLARSYTRDKDGKFASGGGGGSRTGEEFDAAVSAAAGGKTAVKISRVRAADSDVDDAMREYGSIGFRVTNEALRSHRGSIPDGPEQRFARRVTAGMDKAMEHQSLPQDIVVTRGVKDISATLGGRTPVVGMEWVDHGFSSTSTGTKVYGTTGITNGAAQLRILVPKGTRAASSDRFDPGEVVLDRGLKYRAVRVSEPDDYGVRHIDVEVVPDV